MKNQIQKINKKDSQLVNLKSQLDLLLKGQENNSDKLQIIGEELRRGFIGLALRNEELLKSNEQLKQQLNKVQKELNAIKEEQEAKAVRKKARANRKRLPKRDPMTREIYKELIKAAEGPSYINVRTRIALCLLAISGIRINELLSLKVEQLQTLVEESWIAIDRSKRGPTNHSFRIGYITQLWKDTKDIEFVKQTIGHRKLDTTSAYVNQLSDQERQKRIDQLE